MRIGIDIDDVLADTLPAFVRFNNEQFGGSWSLDHFHTAHWEDVLGLTSEQMADRLEVFFDSPSFRSVGPAAEAQSALRELKGPHELHIVSARWDRIVDFTERWLDEHFPGFFNGIHFAANHYTSRANPLGNRRTKDQLLAQHELEVLIEDSLEYAERCLANGFRVILFDRPWNRRGNDPRYHRVQGWREIPATIASLGAQCKRE